MKINKIASSKITTKDCIAVLRQHIINRDDLWQKSYLPRKNLMTDETTIENDSVLIPMYKDWRHYKIKNFPYLDNRFGWSRWWKRKIGNETARLFSTYGFSDFMMVIYELNGVFTRIEYYENIPGSGFGNSLIHDKKISISPIVSENLN